MIEALAQEREAQIAAVRRALVEAREEVLLNGPVSPEELARMEAEQEAQWASEEALVRTDHDG